MPGCDQMRSKTLSTKLTMTKARIAITTPRQQRRHRGEPMRLMTRLARISQKR